MALYTIGDTHLSFSVNKPMEIFGKKWHGHVEKLTQGLSVLTDDDVCVICGDISWGMNLQESLEDFRYIDSFPGEKIILKGNHDYWWTTVKKINEFFAANNISTIRILNNNSFEYGDYAICGTRGWFFEEETGLDHDRKIMNREVLRLKASLDSAGDKEKIVFLHYPPVYQNYRCEEILDLLKEYKVKRCYYGHIHSKGCAFAYNGWIGATQFKLVSADNVDFSPVIVENNTK